MIGGIRTGMPPIIIGIRIPCAGPGTRRWSGPAYSRSHCWQIRLRAHKEHTAQYVALGQNGGGAGHEILASVVGYRHRLVARLVLIDLATLHNLFQLRGNPLVRQLPAGQARHGDTGIPVGDHGDLAGGLVQSLAHLAGEVAQAAHQGILFEDDAAVLVGIIFSRGSPSRIRMVLRISLGMTTRPRSSNTAHDTSRFHL